MERLVGCRPTVFRFGIAFRFAFFLSSSICIYFLGCCTYYFAPTLVYWVGQFTMHAIIYLFLFKY